MWNEIQILLAGFTIFSAFSLIVAYWFFLPDLQKSVCSKLACSALLLGLAGLQWCHYLVFTAAYDALGSRAYLSLLLFVPAGFFYFSRFVLFPETTLRFTLLLHLIPVMLGSLLPKTLVPAIAFLIGTAYCFWFVYLVLKLRQQEGRFHLERFFFVMFAVIAVVALFLGLMIPYIDNEIFYLTYSCAIGAAMFLAVTAIIIFPEMLSDIQQVAGSPYANSKLQGVDVALKKAELEALIKQENVYQNEKLSLSVMAELLDLNPHQLSELINTNYGYGFSRFVRQQRIERARRLLIDEQHASILSISIMTGFRSQSSFYSAFREFTSESPGDYRKRRLNS